jgi:drug/metabolite transporter (DMT)-like permease
MSNESKELTSHNNLNNGEKKEKSISSSQENNVEKKKFINLYICRLSIGIIFTYIFIACSITINIVNRIIFWKYKFKFNITLIFLQQSFCVIFFSIVSKKSKLFKKQAGEVSFSDFLKLRYQYIGYSIFFIFKTLTSFIAYQFVTNIPMYVNLRKFLTAMTFIYQWFFKKKKISNINILVVILLTLGAFLAGIDDYSTDIKGYLAVFMKNTFNLINLEVSENFKKKNGVTNLKLLVYNSFLSTPILFITVFISGEYKKLYNYFSEQHEFSYINLFIFLFISCSVVMITNSSFFISNEKNTSLFTQLLSDTKYIVITLISYLVLKSFTFTWKNVTGLFLSTLAAIIITISTLYDNIQIKKPISDKNKYAIVQEVQIEGSTKEIIDLNAITNHINN